VRTGKRAHRKGDFSSTAKAMASDAEKEMKKLKDQGGDNRTETDGNKSQVDFGELDARIKQSKRNATTVWWRLEDMEQSSAKEEIEGACILCGEFFPPKQVKMLMFSNDELVRRTRGLDVECWRYDKYF
jgi:hypothetical protein